MKYLNEALQIHFVDRFIFAMVDLVRQSIVQASVFHEVDLIFKTQAEGILFWPGAIAAGAWVQLYGVLGRKT